MPDPSDAWHRNVTVGAPQSLAAHADVVSRSPQRLRTTLRSFSTAVAPGHAYDDTISAQDELRAALVGIHELLEAA